MLTADQYDCVTVSNTRLTFKETQREQEKRTTEVK